MYRRSVIRLIPVDWESYAIPINVIADIPKIQDLSGNIETLLVGYYFILSTDVIIYPEADYLVVERELEGH